MGIPLLVSLIFYEPEKRIHRNDTLSVAAYQQRVDFGFSQLAFGIEGQHREGTDCFGKRLQIARRTTSEAGQFFEQPKLINH